MAKKLVKRTCREISGNTPAVGGEQRLSHPLSHYAEQSAWVLLAPAGAGKTVAFRTEAKRLGACYVTARNFIALNEPAWRNNTLFIDALDEMRAGSQDGRTPLDAIRTKLDRLGRPPFRLSCREADWFGASDRTHLTAVSGDREVVELGLDPLTPKDVWKLLDGRVDDPAAFVQHAKTAGLSSLLTTPQCLELLAKAVASGGWPGSRLETFDFACRQLAREQNEEYRIATANAAVGTGDVLAAAGQLCALLLLSGCDAVATTPEPDGGVLQLQDVPGSQQIFRAALRTSLFSFTASGRACQHATPVHRQVAEFLAAKHLAAVIEDGLPPGRVMALMTGRDGGVVSSLRGLCAWLAAHSRKLRPDCIDRDPLGTLLYGDVKGFGVDEKRHLVKRIKQLAMHDPRCLENRFDLNSRWGDLVTPDAEPIFRDLLRTLPHDEAGQRLATAVLLALRENTLVGLPATLLMDVARDEERTPEARELAVAAFTRQHPDDDSSVRQLRALLDDIACGTVSDPMDGLTGVLLRHLYPKHVPPAELWRHLHQPRRWNYMGTYRHFWENELIGISTYAQLGDVLDSLTARLKPWRTGALTETHSQILAKLLIRNAEPEPKRLVTWLLKLDRNWDPRFPKALVGWLSKKPARGAPLLAAAEQMDGFEALEVANYVRHCVGVAEQTSRAEQAASETLGQKVTPQNPEQARVKQSWQSFVRENATARQSWPPDILERLAWLCRGMFGDEVKGDTPSERLHWLLDDSELVEVALDAIGSTPNRDDLPSVAEIAGLKANQLHPLAAPFLVALDLEQSSPAMPPMREHRLQIALAFQFAASAGVPDWPRWYAAALKESPRLVASTLVKYCRAAFRAGNAPRATLAPLAHDATHAEVAALVNVDLLRLFPPRCKAEHLPTLRLLLAAALRHASRPDLTALVRHKLSLHSLTGMQRVHWRCCGLTLDADTHIEPLLALLAGRHRDQRIQCAADLINAEDSEERVLNVQALAARPAEMLLRHLAAHCPPASLFDDPSPYPIVGDMDASARAASAVRRLLAHLASLTTECATRALAQLVSDPNLDQWHSQLRNAHTRQLQTRREAEFRHPTIAQLLATLRGAEPANVADLAELAADHLISLATQVRQGDTSDWRQYWNTDEHKRPTEPRHENVCRDALLSDLRPALPAGVTADQESTCADDRRADIRIAYGDFAVPVEMKRSHAQDLWKAIHTQLADQYAQDPAAQGHGIYVVFWFGRDHCQRAPDGFTPSNAAELEERLQQALTPPQRGKIRVVVVDVSQAA